MKKKLRDALVGGATVALLLYAAVTAAKNMASALDNPGQARASCVAGPGHACPTPAQAPLPLLVARGGRD
jgi:hypothetical protein